MQTDTDISVLPLIEAYLTNKKGKFASIRNYVNSNGEISNQVFIPNPDMQKLIARDIHFLQHYQAPDPIHEQARVELLANKLRNLSDHSRTLQSRASRDTYQQLCPGIKQHLETGDIYITGYLVSKKILIPGQDKKTKSSALTLAKRRIEKQLRSSKYRQFKISNLAATKVNGKILELN